MKRNIRIIAAAVLIALAPVASAEDLATNPGQSRISARLASAFTPMAGSRENAHSLVTALRNATEVTLLAPAEGGTGDPAATTFTPPTKPMGWGNVSHALSLAQDSLSRLGITNPTNAELQAALMGGEVVGADGTTVQLRGILQMRADGMGWGQIARASGTTMGAVVSSTKAMQGKVPAMTTTTATNSTPTTTAKSPAGITTAEGSRAMAAGGKASKGITTAEGSRAMAAGGKASKGITTASGASPAGRGPSKGITTASGVAASSASSGLVTADGSIASHGRSGSVTTAAPAAGGGHAYGRGLVTASGSAAGAGVTVAATHGRGAGLVSATGAPASTNASITSAAGPGNGPGKGNGKGNGNGRGG